MTFSIRPFSEADYPALADLISANFAQRVSAQSLRADDVRRDPRCRHATWFAVVEGQPVGYARYAQHAGNYHPQKFDVSVAVLPPYRGQGIGRALYQTLRDALAPFDPLALTTGVREDRADGIAFATRRGFAERLVNWESHLDLAAFDPAAFAPAVAAAEAQGYQFVSYSDLGGTEEERDRRIYALVSEVRRDIPSPTPRAEIPYETWLKGLHRPQFLPEAFLLAVRDGSLVGLSHVWTCDEPGELETGITGVLRSHRGAGVAKALKVKSLEVAKSLGYGKVKTWNAKQNEGMLAVNRWLGFERKPGWISFVLTLGVE